MKLDPVNQKDLKGSHKNAKDKDINNDGKVNSSDEYLHNRRQAVSKALGKLKEEALDESRQLLAARKSAERAADQKVRVDKKNYDWGKMITVHDGTRKSFPLHPEHQEKIKNLKDGGSTTFTDETRRKVKAQREGDTVHLQHADSDKKTSVAHSHFTEEVDLEEKKLTAKDVKNALASAKAKPKETVSLKKPPFKMDEEAEELDEISSNLLRKAAKVADYNHQAQIDMQKTYMPKRKGEVPSVKAAHDRAMKFRIAALMKDYTTKKEEVELDEAKKAKPGHNAMVMAKNIGKVLAAVKKEETDDTSTIAKHTKPLRMKLAQFRHEE